MKKSTLVALSTLFLLSNISLLLAEEIRVINKTDVPLNVWFLNSENKWTYLPLQPKQSSFFNYKDDGAYYVATKTRTNEASEQPLGWMNFHKMKERSAGASLVIESKVIGTKTEDVVYTVYKPVWETRTEEKTIMCWQLINGRCVLVPKKITENYSVCQMVLENCVKTVIHNVFKFIADAQDSGGTITTEVIFITKNSGARIRYRLGALKDENANKSNNLTTTTENIGIGTYIMWSERDGKRTSKKHVYEIYGNSPKSITFEENL